MHFVIGCRLSSAVVVVIDHFSSDILSSIRIDLRLNIPVLDRQTVVVTVLLILDLTVLDRSDQVLILCRSWHGCRGEISLNDRFFDKELGTFSGFNHRVLLSGVSLTPGPTNLLKTVLSHLVTFCIPIVVVFRLLWLNAWQTWPINHISLRSDFAFWPVRVIFVLRLEFLRLLEIVKVIELAFASVVAAECLLIEHALVSVWPLILRHDKQAHAVKFLFFVTGIEWRHRSLACGFFLLKVWLV